MNRILLILLLSVHTCWSQVDSSNFIPDVIYLDVPFVSLDQELEAYEFKLFDRWGELLLETNDINFRLEHDDKFRNMMDHELFFFLKIQVAGQELQTFKGVIRCVGYKFCG